MSTLALIRHGIRPRLVAVAAITVSLFALTCLGMWISRSVDASIYTSLPEATLALVGIPVGAGIEVMAYSQMIAFIGALTAAAHAVAVGSDLIAGEEQDRTLPLLLAHPVSRLELVAAKAAALIATTTLTALGLWLASRGAAWLFGVELGQTHLGALTVALGANALFSGAVAFGVGAATGNRSLAAGTAVAAGLAADEQSHRLAMLLPATSRMRLLGATLTAQLVLVVALAALTGVGIWAGARLGHMELPTQHIAGAATHLAALGVFVSATALVAAAALGRPAATIWSAVGVGVVGYAVNAAAAMGPGDPAWARLSPFHWYGASRPLHDGADWAAVGVLLGGAALLWGVSFLLFQRRDLAR